jgi:cytochrome c
MRVIVAILALLPLLGGAALADELREGQRVFARRCAVCHQIVTPEGETLVRGNRTGPNLFGIIGRPLGSVPGFDRYGSGLLAAGEAGLVWTEAAMAAYLEDPRGWLRAALQDGGAQSRMIFRLRDAAEREAVAAYLATME